MVLSLNRNLYRFFFWVCVVAILLLATMPLPMPQLELSFSDKLNHIVAFMVLFLLSESSYKVNFWFIFSTLLGYGFLIECIQSVLPYRDFSWGDLLADAFGMGSGLMLKRMMIKLKIIKDVS